MIRRFLDVMPYVGRLRKHIRVERARQGRYPGGHYYSPVPSPEDIDRHITSGKERQGSLAEIDLHDEEQLRLIQDYESFYAELPFPEERNTECRYYFRQNWFCYADAIFLHCHLRHTFPKRIVEVGSGFSSAVILDTVDRFFPDRPETTFIDPNPDRLREVLKPSDQESCRILEIPVQDVPREIFSSLQESDLLFVDSSHVLKLGSDLEFLLFDVLPRLNPGVFVHFHDIMYPFQYPDEWLRMGRFWNEAYFLRAFLAYNSEWSVHFFNSYVASRFRDILAKSMPLCLKNSGGSLYICRNQEQVRPCGGRRRGREMPK